MSATREDRLREELVAAIVARTGLRAELAAPYAHAVMAHLQERYSGECLYVPMRRTRHDRAVIEAELRRGDSAAAVQRRHGIGRSSLARMFPGGLPKPRKVVAARGRERTHG